MRYVERHNGGYNWGTSRCAIIIGAYKTETRMVRWATVAEPTAAERKACRISEGNEINLVVEPLAGDYFSCSEDIYCAAPKLPS